VAAKVGRRVPVAALNPVEALPMSERIEVYFDGACRLCRASRRWAEARDALHRLRFHDFTDAAEAASLPVDASVLAEEMVVKTGAGTIARGFAAWLLVLDALPRWRWLGRFLGVPPARWVGPAAYRFVARHRRWFPMAVSGGCADGACRIPRE